MENPSGIRIVVKFNDDDREKVVVSTLVEDAEQIGIRFYLKSSDGADKLLTELWIEDTSLLVRMEDQLENSLSEGKFYIRNGQLVMELNRPAYKEKLQEKVLANL